ncbi:MAG TPA: MazG family protein [Geopsychrobacteraceae bacterium]|nr:MazG family protein [Geopsychrobacteraceae bacterium]
MPDDITSLSLDAIKRLLLTMETLRGPCGCEWDRYQTPESLKKYILEEAYEVIEAIDRGDPLEVCEELGDLLLQIVFQAQIFREKGAFSMVEIADSINQKLLRRHPHIFINTASESIDSDWERIKTKELLDKGKSTSLRDRIPLSFPALKRAEKLAKALTRTTEVTQGVNKTCELAATEALTQLNQQETKQKITEQLIGDALFELTNLAKFHGVDAEDSLRQAVDRRIKLYDEGST